MPIPALDLASNQIAGNSGIFSQIQNMMNMAKSFNDPNAFLDAMSASNPQVTDIKNLINQYNGNAQAAFYAKAKEMGVDPNMVLSMIPR